VARKSPRTLGRRGLLAGGAGAAAALAAADTIYAAAAGPAASPVQEPTTMVMTASRPSVPPAQPAATTGSPYREAAGAGHYFEMSRDRIDAFCSDGIKAAERVWWVEESQDGVPREGTRGWLLAKYDIEAAGRLAYGESAATTPRAAEPVAIPVVDEYESDPWPFALAPQDLRAVYARTDFLDRDWQRILPHVVTQLYEERGPFRRYEARFKAIVERVTAVDREAADALADTWCGHYVRVGYFASRLAYALGRTADPAPAAIAGWLGRAEALLRDPEGAPEVAALHPDAAAEPDAIASWLRDQALADASPREAIAKLLHDQDALERLRATA
jgi:hypothetical protein